MEDTNSKYNAWNNKANGSMMSSKKENRKKDVKSGFDISQVGSTFGQKDISIMRTMTKVTSVGKKKVFRC